MTETIAELEARLAQSATLVEEIDALNELAWELRHMDVARSLDLSLKAFTLASSPRLLDGPYRAGKAASLVTMGFLNYEKGKLDLALEQCFEAVALNEGMPPARTTADALRVIGWVHYFVGDLAKALDYHIQAMSLAQAMGLKVLEASVLDGMAVIYAETGEPQQSLHCHEEALGLVRSIGKETLEASILNNYAANLLSFGDYPKALELSQKSLEMARRLSLVEPLLSILDTLGNVQFKLGMYTEAEQSLRENLALAANREMDQADSLTTLGMLYLEQGKLDEASAHLHKALSLAESIGVLPRAAECHQTLSNLYQKKGDYKMAFEHYQRFFALHEKINSEASNKRLVALKVAHEVQAAKRETEIMRQHNQELRREIEERARIELELEKLATIDSLTGVYNRRHFFELGRRELTRSIRYAHPLSIIMIDIDHFKMVNDQHGHAAGDRMLVLLTDLIRRSLRSVDLIGRYGGEEFCIAVPETGLEQALAVAERIRRSVDEQEFVTTASRISLTISVGVASLQVENGRMTNCARQDIYEWLDKLIDCADQALLNAKRSGRNRVEFYTGGCDTGPQPDLRL